MDKPETRLMQKTPSRPQGKEAKIERSETHKVGSDLEALLPFCFVRVWPNDIKSRDIVRDAVKLFVERDQQHLQLSEMIREKAFERNLLIGRLEDLRYMLRRLNLELSELSNARGTPAEEDFDSHIVSDKLMEMRKKKQTLEAKIEDVEKEFEAIIEAIWSPMEHLKDKHHRSEANVCILDHMKVHGCEDRLFFEYCYLESIHTSFTSMKKSSLYTL